MKSLLSAFSFLLFAFSFSASAQMDFTDIPYLSIARTPNTGSPNVTAGLVAWYKFDEGSGIHPLDSSGNSFTGTFAGSPNPDWTNDAQVGPFATSYDGAAAYTDLADQITNYLSSGVDFSVTAWVKLRGDTTVHVQNVVSSGVGAANRFFMQLDTSQYGSFGAFYYVGIYTGSFKSAGTFGTGGRINTNTWYHLTAVYSNGTMIAFTNAVNCGTAADPNTDSLTTTHIGIGLPAAQTGFFGIIDDVRVYNRVLTGAEITTIYNYR